MSTVLRDGQAPTSGIYGLREFDRNETPAVTPSGAAVRVAKQKDTRNWKPSRPGDDVSPRANTIIELNGNQGSRPEAAASTSRRTSGSGSRNEVAC